MIRTAVIRCSLEGGVLFVAIAATLLLRSSRDLFDWTDVTQVLLQTSVLVACWVVACYPTRLYDRQAVRTATQLVIRLLMAMGLTMALLIVCYDVLPMAKMMADWFETSVFIIAALTWPLRAFSQHAIRSRLVTERVLLFGSGPLAPALVTEIRAHPESGLALVGALEEETAARPLPLHCPVLGSIASLSELVRTVRPDRILVALSAERGPIPAQELLECRTHGIVIEKDVDAYERITGKLAIEALTPTTLLFAPGFRRYRLGLALARGLNFAVSLAALVAFAPLFVLIALAVKLDSKGPVYFVQQRLGQHGRPFNLIKFRTMRPTHRHQSEWARDNTDRITRVGGWLRRFRLDELPQLINVLRGEMSLVGPRPHPVTNGRLFLQQIPHYSLRSMVPPGVTGWAQVRYGYANGLEEETEKMRYDLYYIKHMSLWFDLRILLETAKAVIRGPDAEHSRREQPWPSDYPTMRGFRRAA